MMRDKIIALFDRLYLAIAIIGGMSVLGLQAYALLSTVSKEEVDGTLIVY